MTALRIGILDDMADEAPGPFDVNSWLDLALGEVRASGRLDVDIEVVTAYGLGLPSGSLAGVERAYLSLVEQDALLVVGPAIGEDALLVTDLAERLGVPTINWAGTERARGRWMFHLQVGSHEDEAALLCAHLADVGATRVAIVHDESEIGERYLDFVRTEAAIAGLDICAVSTVDPLATSFDAAAPLAAAPEAVMYLGLGRSAAAVAGAVASAGWAGPRVMNASGMFGYEPAVGRALEGWVYVDVFADHNRTLQRVRRNTGIPAAAGFVPAVGYDLGRLVAEGLARAPELTRTGVLAGLERIKSLPAAEGHDGTLLGFGHYDRGALHGRYLVLRRWQDGRTLQVSAAGRMGS